MRIRLSGLSLQDYNKSYGDHCVTFWYNSKYRRINQKKTKMYQQREVTKKQRAVFNIYDLSSSSSESVSSEIEDIDM